MKIEIEQHSDIAVLIVTGGLVGDEADDLVSTVQQTLEEGARKFVVDLKDVGRIDSGGLGSLVAAYIVVDKQGGRMVVVPHETYFNPSLIMTRQLQVFEVYSSREEAIEALRKPDPAPAPAESKTPRDFTGCLIAACVFLIAGSMTLAGKLLFWIYHWLNAQAP